VCPGHCDPRKKLIQVLDANDELTIIHEICHAATRSSGHGEKWQKRFLKVAEMANVLGNLKLSEAIKAEVKRYHEQIKDLPEISASAQIFREQISQAARDAPDASFGDIVRYVAGEHGMYTEELLKHYPKALRKAFDDAHNLLEIARTRRQKLGSK